MPIPWSKKISVNVKEIDDQHKHFLGILNNLYDAIYKIKLKEKLGELLNELSDYTDIHFATEEKYFDQFHYDLADEHKKEHNQLKAKVAQFNERFKTEGEDVAAELVDFLEDWLLDHLENQDKKYSKFFNEQGLF